MTTLTISSQAKLNGTPVSARFTTITLSTDPDPDLNAYPDQLTGDPALKRPLTFEWTWQHVRQKIASDLAAIAAEIEFGPYRSMAGSYVAIVNPGCELCHFAWSEIDRTTGQAVSRSADGYITIPNASLQGIGERLTIILKPVDRLRFIGSSDYLEPQ